VHNLIQASYFRTPQAAQLGKLLPRR
jgi:hypothetical protein